MTDEYPKMSRRILPGVEATGSGIDFVALVDAYYRALHRFAMSLTRSEAEASDATQQTFAIWAAKGHQLRDPSKVKTWLYTTLHRECLRARRERTRLRPDELDEESGDVPFVEPSSEQRIDAKSALEALARLRDPYRAPLSLFYLGEYSYQEIAEILNIPIGTAKSRISRGKAQLQRMLSSGGSERSDVGASYSASVGGSGVVRGIELAGPHSRSGEAIGQRCTWTLSGRSV